MLVYHVIYCVWQINKIKINKKIDENQTCFGYRIQTTRCFHLIPHWISRFTHQNKRN